MEREKRFFGFDPVTNLVDRTISSVNDYILHAAEELELFLRAEKKRKRFSLTNDRIAEGIEKFLTILQSRIDRNFDKFEVYVLRNISKIPSDVSVAQLDKPSCPEHDCTDNDEELFDKKIRSLQERLSAERFLCYLYDAEIDLLEREAAALRDLKEGTGTFSSLPVQTVVRRSLLRPSSMFESSLVFDSKSQSMVESLEPALPLEVPEILVHPSFPPDNVQPVQMSEGVKVEDGLDVTSVLMRVD